MDGGREDNPNLESQEETYEVDFQPLVSGDSSTTSPNTASHNSLQNSGNFAQILPDRDDSAARRFFWQRLVLRISNVDYFRYLTELACTHLIPFLQNIFNDNEVNANTRLDLEKAVSKELEILMRHIDELNCQLSLDRTYYWHFEDNQRDIAVLPENENRSENRLEKEVRQVVDALKEVNLADASPVMFEIMLRNGRLSTRRMVPEELFFDSQEEYGWENSLSEKDMQLLPVKKITRENVNLETVCSICLDKFILDEEVRELACDHKFHPKCIFHWFRRKNTCPVCRGAIVASES